MFHSFTSAISRPFRQQSRTSESSQQAALLDDDYRSEERPQQIENIGPQIECEAIDPPPYPGSPAPEPSFETAIIYRPASQPCPVPHAYFFLDTNTGIAYLPLGPQSLPTPVPPPGAIYKHYDFWGVPILSDFNPLQKARDVIVQRYAQEFRGISNLGVGMIRRLVDLDLEREQNLFMTLVWRNVGDDDLVIFAEKLMKGED